MASTKNALTPYGRWIKIQLMDRNMMLKDLAREAGVERVRISELMYGVTLGLKIRPKIEKVLGEPPQDDLTQAG